MFRKAELFPLSCETFRRHLLHEKPQELSHVLDPNGMENISKCLGNTSKGWASVLTNYPLYIYIYICICMYVYVCICMYITVWFHASLSTLRINVSEFNSYRYERTFIILFSLYLQFICIQPWCAFHSVKTHWALPYSRKSHSACWYCFPTFRDNLSISSLRVNQ